MIYLRSFIKKKKESASQRGRLGVEVKARKKAEASPPSYRSLPCDIDSNWIEVIVTTCTHGHKTERKYLLDRGTKQGYLNQGVLWEHTDPQNPTNKGIMGKSKAMIEIGKDIPTLGFHGY